MEIDILAFNREYKTTYDTSSTELYQKYIPTVEEMIETFDMLNQHLKKYLANWTRIILLTIFFSF